MSEPTLEDALVRLFEAAANRPLDDRDRADLLEIRQRYQLDDEANVPPYFRQGLVSLSAGTATPWSELAPEDRGHSWMLRELAAAIPGTRFVDDADGTDYLTVPRLGHALAVADRGFAERWSVVPRPLDDVATDTTARVLDTFAPTAEQVRVWAHDPELRFAAQDEDLAVSRPEYLAQLVELAADPRVPKRELIARLVDRIATMPRPDLVETMTRARDLARATGDPGLAAWADTLGRVIAHAAGSGPVDLERARDLAQVLMIGRRRPTVVLDTSRDGDWWHFQARFPEPGARQLDSLYVHAPTGAVAWSWEPLPPDALERLPTRPRMASFAGV